MDKLSIKDELTEFLLYTSPNGEVKVEVFLNKETVWLTQKAIAQLFGVQVPTISKHLKNIFESGELDENSVVSILETTAADGKLYQVKYFNLDAIISVGYRVNSRQATQFRIWATKTLKDYIVKGFILDDSRLKNGRYFGKDYFKELLERVSSIRSSERRIYQQITDIFANVVSTTTPNRTLQVSFMPRTKQISFCHSRKYCRRNYLQKSRFGKRIYGFKHLEECTRWQNFKIGF